MGMKKNVGKNKRNKTRKWLTGIGAAILVLGIANAMGYFGNAVADISHQGMWIGIGVVVVGLTMFGEYLKG